MAEPLREASDVSQGSKLAAAPAGPSSTAAYSAAPAVETAAKHEDEYSVPVSPLGMHGMKELLKKPFGDVLKSAAANLQVGLLEASVHFAAKQRSSKRQHTLVQVCLGAF